MESPFVPKEFEPPRSLVTSAFRLEPLGAQHNERDHDAWMSSVAYIRSLPGFDDPLDPDPWPVPMPSEENLAELEEHARQFEARESFTYTVLDHGSGDVIGCVYIYPAKSEEHDADVRCWVRESCADLDETLRREIASWLRRDWPFRAVIGP